MQGHFQIMFNPKVCPLFQSKLSWGMRILYSSGVWSYVCAAISTPTFIIIPLVSIHCKPQTSIKDQLQEYDNIPYLVNLLQVFVCGLSHSVLKQMFQVLVSSIYCLCIGHKRMCSAWISGKLSSALVLSTCHAAVSCRSFCTMLRVLHVK